jgi:hypothetical protein
VILFAERKGRVSLTISLRKEIGHPTISTARL